MYSMVYWCMSSNNLPTKSEFLQEYVIYGMVVYVQQKDPTFLVNSENPSL